MGSKIGLLILPLLLFMEFSSGSIQAVERIIIGEVEKVTLLPWGVVLPARIDTGAGMSALDVRDLKLEGKTVEFRLPEEYGDLRIRLPLARWCSVKNPGIQRQRRPAVEMDLCLGHVQIRTLVTLANRSHMEFPLLIGRRALRGNPEANFIVDVSRSYILIPDCGKENLP